MRAQQGRPANVLDARGMAESRSNTDYGPEVSHTLQAAKRLFVLRNALRIGAYVMPCLQAFLWCPHCHTGHHLVLLQAQVLMSGELGEDSEANIRTFDMKTTQSPLCAVMQFGKFAHAHDKLVAKE